MLLRATILVLLAGGSLHADTFEGTVRKVLDGDTMEIHDRDGKVSTFRLLGADAPELGQRGYWDALMALHGHVMNKAVTVDWVRAQICPRAGGSCAQLAKVYLKGEDIALRQIAQGFAWHDLRQIREQSTTDKTLYKDAQFAAQEKRRGVWKSRKPKPPWDFVLRPIPKALKKEKRKPSSVAPRKKSKKKPAKRKAKHSDK